MWGVPLCQCSASNLFIENVQLSIISQMCGGTRRKISNTPLENQSSTLNQCYGDSDYRFIAPLLSQQIHSVKLLSSSNSQLLLKSVLHNVFSMAQGSISRLTLSNSNLPWKISPFQNFHHVTYFCSLKSDMGSSPESK